MHERRLGKPHQSRYTLRNVHKEVHYEYTKKLEWKPQTPAAKSGDSVQNISAAQQGLGVGRIQSFLTATTRWPREQ